jgi:hypothetical protein
MTATYWLADEAGVKALAATPAELSTLKRLGWVDATEPAGNEFVWMQHDTHGGRQKFAAGAVDVWRALGWVLSGPPELAELPVAEVAAAPKTPAAGGDTKEKR